uniref:HD protein 3 n=1 Tax=Auricularia cornea TaxID=1238391 RepID=A0A8K1X8P3_9AGAM|nr:HD protein 3 [Auricularia cornea]
MRQSTTPARKERTARSTPAQRDLLQDAFERNPRPDANEIQVLAEDIGMEPQHVSQWFSSKRCRMNKAFSKAATVSGGTPPPFYAPSPPTNALQLTLSGMAFPDSATPILIVAPKRPKPRVSPAQEDALQELFDRAPHATMDEKKQLAEDVGLTVSKVNSWFTFARATQLPAREHKALADAAFLPPITFVDVPSSPGPSRTLRTRMRPAPYQRSSSYSDEYTPGKRTRSRPSPEQLVVLKREFAQHSNPSMEIRVRLSQELEMSVAKITDWFRNLRASLARQAKKKAVLEATPRSGDGDMDEDDEDSLNLAIEAMDDMDIDPPPTFVDDDGDETESDDEPLPTPVFGGTPRLPLDVFSPSQTCSPRSSELRSTLSLAVDEEEKQLCTKEPDADALLAAGILVGALRKGVRAPDVEIQLASQLAFLLEQKRAGSSPMTESRASSEAPGAAR